MPKRRKSLRRKLTFWMVAVSAVIQGTFVVLILLYEGNAANRFFNQRFQLRATTIAREVDAMLARVNDAELTRLAANNTTQFILFHGFALVVYAPDGSVLASTDRPAPDYATTREADPNHPDRLRPYTTYHFNFPSLKNTEDRVRAVSVDLHRPDEGAYRLLVATTDTAVRQLTARLRQVLLIALLAGLAGSAIAAWIISGIATEPLKRVLESMKGMNPGTVGRSVDMDGGSEELAVVRRELDAMRARMEMGFKSQERFISNVSHEIKTPISVLLTEMQTLPPLDTTPEEVRSFIQSVGDEMRRLGGMVESFLLLTRVRDGKPFHTKVGTYQINEMILDAIESSTALANHYEAILTPTLLDQDEDLDLAIRGAPDLLRTMLDNLIRNAIRFSPPGQRVQIAARRLGNEAEIEVRDLGPGIPEELLSTIFDRFAQSDTEFKRGRGHGLGLEIAQGIAELHGGDITVENCKDRGCRFIVRLPLDHAPGSRRHPDTWGM